MESYYKVSTNTAAEFNLITKLLNEKSPELLVSVSPEYLGNVELRKIFLVIRKHFMEHSSFLGWEALSTFIAKVCTTTDKAKFMLGLLDQLKSRDVSGLTNEVLVKELQDYYKFNCCIS